MGPRRPTSGIRRAAALPPIEQDGHGSPQSPRDKSLGEFSELLTNYEGSHKAARVGLTMALDAGKMRNPLQMQQASQQWASRRPLSAGTTPGPGSRGQPAVQGSAQHSPTSGGRAAARLGHSGQAPLMVQTSGRPSMLKPQRIELPSYLNTPPRRPETEALPPEDRTLSFRRLQDLELLIFACRRASKVREEGRAHFSVAVLRDNLGLYPKAIESYNSFLRVCKECNDGQGSALAYHCIAVDYQLMSESAGGAVDAATATIGASIRDPSPANQLGASGSQPPASASQGNRLDFLRKAIFFHNKHRESSDSVGKFVAHLNMGLAYAALGEKEASTVNHQYALRYALQLHSLEGQSLAIGSLSFSAGMYDNDPEKMRVLVERYVDLCNTLKQPRNQASALKKLGILASQQGNTDESISYFQQAITCARAQGDNEAEKDCSVRLGIAAGQARMAEHLSTILQNSVVRSLNISANG